MINVRMSIEYDGSDFFGWQYQPQKRTVQGEIEAALKKITGRDVKLIGAGRTDKGVHALGQIANFHTTSDLGLGQIKNGVNSLIGDDVYIKNIGRVDDTFNSRYSAESKLYRYHIRSEFSPLQIRYNWCITVRLNLSEMKKVIPYLLGEHDFRNFTAADENDNKVCKIYDMNLTEENSHIIIYIKGNRFLRKMVRGIVGFIYDVGRGRFSPDDTHDVFTGKIKEIYFVPPQGLFLVEVRY